MLLEAYEQELVVWTIRIAMILMFVSLALRCGWKQRNFVQPGKMDSKSDFNKAKRLPWTIELAQHSWLLGSLFALMHTMVTLVMVFDGSHAAAYEHTAVTTEAYLGVRVGFGIYANHLFVALWLMDSLWWLANPTSYQARRILLDQAILGFLIFIAINGTIVFASGPIRWIAMIAFVGLGARWWTAPRLPDTMHDSESEDFAPG